MCTCLMTFICLSEVDMYVMQNADEYWAELTQSWFEATARIGKGSLSSSTLLLLEC